MYRYLILTSLIIIISSCEKKNAIQKVTESEFIDFTDTNDISNISSLLDTALEKDSFEYFSYTLRFYSGNLLSDTIKHAFILYKENKKSIFDIYTFDKKAYTLVKSLDSLDLFWTSTGIDTKDVNFDNIKELQIIRSVSNGYATTSSYVYLFDGKGDFLKVIEADTMANFSIEGKYVTSDKLITCTEQGKDIAKNYFMWKGIKLIYIKTVTPCENYEMW